MRTAHQLVIVTAMLVAPACKKETKPQPSAGSAATVSAGSGSATGSGSASGSAAATAPAATATLLPAKLAEGEGVVFAETKGGTVELMAADGSKTQLADGTRVKITRAGEADMSDQDPITHEVEVDGKTGTLPAARVLTESGLKRSPDGKFAVFVADEQCGDLCHTRLFILAADGTRKELGDGVVDVAVAWHKDGAQAAVGSASLWLVTLPSLEVNAIESYTSPSYAPDGTLYVRDHGGSAFMLAGGTAKLAWKAPKKKADPDDYGAEQPPPVTFDAAGKPTFVLP